MALFCVLRLFSGEITFFSNYSSQNIQLIEGQCVAIFKRNKIFHLCDTTKISLIYFFLCFDEDRGLGGYTLEEKTHFKNLL